MTTTARERSKIHDRLARLGVSFYDAEAFRRIAMTLHHWHEKECGTAHGCIERDEATAKTYWLNSETGRRSPMADRETGALKRLAVLMEKYPALICYVQTDPRGASLYLLTTEQARGPSPLESIYNRGAAVY